jgi:3-dehydroquinate synthetase
VHEALTSAARNENAWLLCDEVLTQWHSEAINSCFSPEKIHFITASEQSKSFSELEPIFAWLLSTGFRRDCTLICLGGAWAK